MRTSSLRQRHKHHVLSSWMQEPRETHQNPSFPNNLLVSDRSSMWQIKTRIWGNHSKNEKSQNMYFIVWTNTFHKPTNTLVDACAKESPWLCPLSRSTHNNLLTTHRARNHRAISAQWALLLLKHWSQASSPAKPLTCYQTRICR